MTHAQFYLAPSHAQSDPSGLSLRVDRVPESIQQRLLSAKGKVLEGSEVL